MIPSGITVSVTIQNARLAGPSVSRTIAEVRPWRQRAGLFTCCSRASHFDAAAGMTVSATSIDAMTAMAMVSARSAKSWPASSSRNTMGRKMATVVAVDASRAPHTCSGPMSAASSAAMPRSRSRTMFSSTTMAASRVIPTANARPASEMMLTVRPAKSRPRNAANNEIGIATATSSVARNRRRNSHSTTMASATPRPRLLRTISIERLM